MAAAGCGGQAPQLSARKAFPDECRGSCRASTQTAPNTQSEIGREQGTVAAKELAAADARLSLGSFSQSGGSATGGTSGAAIPRPGDFQNGLALSKRP